MFVSSTYKQEQCHFLFYRPLGSLRTKISSKTINKPVRQYFSTTSLIASPVNGLLCLVVELILVSLTDCSFAYDHFQKTRQTCTRWEKDCTFCGYFCYIGTFGKTARRTCPIVDLLTHKCMEKGHWAGLKCTPDVNVCAFLAYFCIGLLYV